MDDGGEFKLWWLWDMTLLRGPGEGDIALRPMPELGEMPLKEL